MAIANYIIVLFFKQKTAYEVKECDWSSDVCSSDLVSKFIERLRKEKVKRYKIPSESQLNLMLEQQIISGEEWLRAIESKGYSKKWAMKLFALLEKEGKIHA